MEACESEAGVRVARFSGVGADATIELLAFRTTASAPDEIVVRRRRRGVCRRRFERHARAARAFRRRLPGCEITLRHLGRTERVRFPVDVTEAVRWLLAMDGFENVMWTTKANCPGAGMVRSSGLFISCGKRTP